MFTLSKPKQRGKPKNEHIIYIPPFAPLAKKTLRPLSAWRCQAGLRLKNNKLKVHGMKAKKYNIYYYDANNPTTPLPIGSTDHQTEWGPELNLQYPVLSSVIRPFVLFKLVVKDNSLPPEFVPNQNGALAGQELSRDSLTEKDSIAGKSEISQQNSAKDNEIKLYPNPNNGNFALALPDNYELGNVQITDVTGKKVFEQKLIEKRTNLHLNLQNGVYYLRFANEKTVQTLQFIVL